MGRQYKGSKGRTDSGLKRSLDSSMAEGFFSSASINLAGSYITPYALHLGASKPEIGLISMLQGLGSATAQIPGARIVGRLSRKSIWYLSYSVSRLLLVAVAFSFMMPYGGIAALMALVFAVYFFNGLRNPAWSSLMGDLVPRKKAGRFFGKRNMVVGIAELLAMLSAAWIIQSWGFQMLFAAAAAIGMAAVYFFNRIGEPPLRSLFSYRPSISLDPARWVEPIRLNPSFAWFTLYVALASFAVAMSSPFYPVRMLSEIGIGYGWYSLLLAVNVLVSILSLLYWGRLIDRHGERSILAVTGIMMCFIPLFWAFASSLPFLLFIQVYDGFIFDGWLMVTFNILISTCPENKKAGYVANHSFLVGMAAVAGTLASTLLVGVFEKGTLFGMGGLGALFMLSFLFRLSSVFILPKIKCSVKPRRPFLPLLRQLILVEPPRAAWKGMGYAFSLRWMHRRAVREACRSLAWRVKLWMSDKFVRSPLDIRGARHFNGMAAIESAAERNGSHADGQENDIRQQSARGMHEIAIHEKAAGKDAAAKAGAAEDAGKGKGLCAGRPDAQPENK